MNRWGTPILALLLSLFLFSQVQAQDEVGPRGIRLGPLKVFPRGPEPVNLVVPGEVLEEAD